MRIITGSAKGITLKTLEGDATRPTSERVKEAVFSMIQFDLEERRVLDLFSGSGQMALEALSRGASSATLVDKSRDSINIIKYNANKTKLFDRCAIYQSDYLDFIKRNYGNKYDIVFLDPPYTLKMYKPALQALLDSSMLKPSTLIICESGEDTVFDGDEALAARFTIEKQSRYSKTYITIFKPLI